MVEVVGEQGEVTAAKLNQMKYLKACLHESQRLWPAVAGFNRRTQVDIVLYCTVLYLLYCAVLYCTVLYCTVLYCTVLYRWTWCWRATGSPAVQWSRESHT